MKLLTRQELIADFQKKYAMDISAGLRVVTVDHSDNPLAPEPTCYKLYFAGIDGNRRRLAYWPDTVGYQGF